MIELSNFFDADELLLSGLEDLLNYYAKEFHLDTRLRQAHFLAQIREEVGKKFRYARAENLNYSCVALRKLFKYFKRHKDEAQQFGRCFGHNANQKAIANRVYANRLGNGAVISGDGYLYRGRGMIQLTGKANYLAIQKEIENKTGISLDLVDNPDLLLTPAIGMLSAMAFWSLNKIYLLADKGDTVADVNAVTRVVNRYTNSYAKRVNHFRYIAKLYPVRETIYS